jgi:hypothetical protein
VGTSLPTMDSMPRRRPFDDSGLHGLLTVQQGLVTLKQLSRLGMSPSTISHRCRDGGPWQRPLPGIVAVTSGQLNSRQRLEAAMLYGGQSAILTGGAALGLYGLRRGPATPPLLLLVADSRQRASRGFVILERTDRKPEVRMIDGLPVATPARAVADAARRMRALDDVRAMVAESVQRGRATPTDLLHELESGQRRGSRLLRLALAEIVDGILSVAEADARMLALRRRSLQHLMWNPWIYHEDRFLLSPDGWADDVAMAWEIDSLEYHLSPAAYAKTLRRHADATAAGIVLLHSLPSDLRRRPEECLDELEATYTAAQRRPRPPVVAKPNPMQLQRPA